MSTPIARDRSLLDAAVAEFRVRHNLSQATGELKENIYHDELGRFTSAENAVTLSGKVETTGTEKEAALRSLDLNKVDWNANYGGSSSVYFLTDDSGHRRAVIKPASGLDDDKLRENIPAKSDIEREQAAYLLNKRLGGLVRMPTVAVIGSGPDRKLVTEFVEEGSSYVPLSNIPDEVDNAAFFDALIGNEDRHSRNYLIDPDGHLVCIDHGVSFPTKAYNDINFNDGFFGGESQPSNSFDRQGNEATQHLGKRPSSGYQRAETFDWQESC